MTTTFNFTPESINRLPLPEKGIRTYRDGQHHALALYVTSAGAKTFFVRKRIQKRDQRVRIGSFPELTVAQARAQASLLAAEIEMGRDPLEAKRIELANSKTFEDIARSFIERQAKRRNKSWQAQQRDIQRYLKPLLKKERSRISRDDVADLHEKIGVRSPFQANRMLSLIKTIYNYDIKTGWEGRNPAKGIEPYKEKSRDRFVLPEEMPFLIQAIEMETQAWAKDFFWMALLTGARKQNIQEMRFDQIDKQYRHWRIPDTKNGEPVLVPLVDKAMAILERRRTEVQSEWVFPNRNDPNRPLNDPKTAWERVRARATILIWRKEKELVPLIDEASRSDSPYTLPGEDKIVRLVKKRAKAVGLKLPKDMIDLRIHDLRRTFGSYQAITGASLTVIGKSLGHKSLAATQIYARLNLDPVRAAIEKATSAMLGY